MVRSIDPGSCGCFGIGISLSIRQTAGLDAFLLVVSLAVAVLSKEGSPYSLDQWFVAADTPKKQR
jgi:hypothetical protein